jgi:hypothetical protein
VLYEMLAARRAFQGNSSIETMTAIHSSHVGSECNSYFTNCRRCWVKSRVA